MKLIERWHERWLDKQPDDPYTLEEIREILSKEFPGYHLARNPEPRKKKPEPEGGVE